MYAIVLYEKDIEFCVIGKVDISVSRGTKCRVRSIDPIPEKENLSKFFGNSKYRKVNKTYFLVLEKNTRAISFFLVLLPGA